MKIAAVQHDIVWEDAPATRHHLEPMVAAAAAGGARLIVLSEMFATGFSLEADRIAEPVDGPTSQWLAAQAARHHAWIYGSSPAIRAGCPAPQRRRAGGPGRRLAPLRQDAPVHVRPRGGVVRRRGRPRDRDVEGLRVSLFICYDLRFADDWWPLAPRTDVYLCCANWPEAAPIALARPAPGPGHREPGLRRRRQPGRRGRRPRLLGRQPGVRSARGDARRRRAHRDRADHGCRRRSGGEGAGAVPLHAGPSHRPRLSARLLHRSSLSVCWSTTTSVR